jgi:hypothetical protein
VAPFSTGQATVQPRCQELYCRGLRIVIGPHALRMGHLAAQEVVMPFPRFKSVCVPWLDMNFDDEARFGTGSLSGICDLKTEGPTRWLRALWLLALQGAVGSDTSAEDRWRAVQMLHCGPLLRGQMAGRAITS